MEDSYRKLQREIVQLALEHSPELVAELAKERGMELVFNKPSVASTPEPSGTDGDVNYWVHHTPDFGLPPTRDQDGVQEYLLGMYDCGEGIQTVRFTREEYIGVKRWAGRRRGLAWTGEPRKDVPIGPVEAVKLLDTVDAGEAQILASVLQMMRDNRGCDTPVEQYVRGFVRSAATRSMDIAEAQALFDEFKRDASDLYEVVHEYTKKHPYLFEKDPRSRPAA